MRFFAQPQPYTFHTAVARAPVYVEPHRRAAVEISLVLEGTITFLVDGREHSVDSPTATLAACRESLGVRVDAKRRTRVMWCNCRGVRFSPAEWEWLDNVPRVQPLSDRLLDLFNSGLSASDAGRGESNSEMFATQVRDAIGIAAFSEYFRQAGLAPVTLPPAVCVIKQHLDRHFYRPFDSRGLASMVNIHSRHLIKLFDHHVGVSPMRYLWARRVEAGAHQLRTTHRSIEQIAHACGFQTAAHFSRRIKLEYNCSPRDLRRVLLPPGKP